MASGRTRRRANAGAEPRGEPARRASGESGKIQSLKRASSILDAVARRPEGVSLAQISAEVGLRNSTAFHLIQTLVNLGFLTQLAESRRYRIASGCSPWRRGRSTRRPCCRWRRRSWNG